MDEGNPHPASINTGLTLKPVIKELARTQVCFPDIKLLVDRISIVTLAMNQHSKENQTYRLYLSDGEKTIQGMGGPLMLVISGHLWLSSYIRLI